MTISASTIARNRTGDGGAGGSPGSGSAAAGGAGGNGAGVWINAAGMSAIDNSTFALNTAGSGGSGSSGGAGGSGGGLALQQGAVGLASLTVAGNSVGMGGSGAGATGTGGGVLAAPTTSVTEQNTLIAANTAPNCAGNLTDAGHDLSFPDLSCPHDVTGSPSLGP